MIKTEELQNAIDLIGKSENILISTHTRPDGDACGCVQAVHEALKVQGKRAETVYLSEIPQWYDFLFDAAPAILASQAQIDDLLAAAHDLIIIVDVNSTSQLPRFDEFLRRTDAPVLVLDHHLTSDSLGTVEIIDTSASATGLIVMDLFRDAGWPITESIARALFVAVATDTGWFHFSNTNARTYAACAELIEAGADPTQIHHELYQNFSVERFSLMLAMLNSLELHFDGRYADQHITLEDFARTGATRMDTENLIDQCRMIGSVEAAAIFIELDDGTIRCSLRSSGSVDVRLIAQKFDGGGHKMASGTYLPGPIENAKQLIKEEIKNQLN